MYRGDALVFELQVLAPPTVIPGVDIPPQPAPITGWKFYFTVKLYLSDPDTLAVYQTTSNVGGTIQVLDVNNGIVQVTLPGAPTLGFPDSPVDCPYDVKAFDATGRPFTIEAGIITVVPNVTRATS